jgi:hypothetical protein
MRGVVFDCFSLQFPTPEIMTTVMKPTAGTPFRDLLARYDDFRKTRGYSAYLYSKAT